MSESVLVSFGFWEENRKFLALKIVHQVILAEGIFLYVRKCFGFLPILGRELNLECKIVRQAISAEDSFRYI